MSPEAGHWLRLQLVVATIGAGTWYAGVLVGSEFTSGLGVGVLLSALALRFARRRADEGDREG